jgi:hypothetical protein
MVRNGVQGNTNRRSLHSMRFGRDDKGEGGDGPERSSLEHTTADLSTRCASVEMTKGRAVMVRNGVHWNTQPQISPLAALRSR